MKLCPNCSAKNWPDALSCYLCGHVFGEPSQAQPPAAPAGQGEGQPSTDQAGAPDTAWEDSLFTDPEPTRPRRVNPDRRLQPERRVSLGTSSPDRPAWDDSAPHRRQPEIENTRPRKVKPAPTAQVNYTPAPAEQEAQPTPRPGPVLRQDQSRMWQTAAGFLFVGLVCVGAFAIYTLAASLINSGREAAARMATQAAEKIASLPINQPSATAQVQVYITPTPWPTLTTLPPTAAPAPQQSITDTFGGAATPTPVVDFTRYLTAECAAAVEHLRLANQALASNPAAPFDQAWRDDLSLAVSEMKTYCSTLDSASPVPGQVEEAYAYLKYATEAFEKAGRLLEESAKEVSPAKFVEASGQLVQAGIYLRKALSQMSELGSAP